MQIENAKRENVLFEWGHFNSSSEFDHIAWHIVDVHGLAVCSPKLGAEGSESPKTCDFGYQVNPKWWILNVHGGQSQLHPSEGCVSLTLSKKCVSVCTYFEDN